MQNQKIKSIIEQLISSSMKEVKTQLGYLTLSLSEEETYVLYEELSALLVLFSQEFKHETNPTSDISNINSEYAALIQSLKDYSQFVDKIDYILTNIQPLSDHSIRGTIRFLKRNID